MLSWEWMTAGGLAGDLELWTGPRLPKARNRRTGGVVRTLQPDHTGHFATRYRPRCIQISTFRPSYSSLLCCIMVCGVWPGSSVGPCARGRAGPWTCEL